MRMYLCAKAKANKQTNKQTSRRIAKVLDNYPNLLTIANNISVVGELKVFKNMAHI